MSFKILNKKEKEKIIEKLREQFGINEIPYLMIQTGKEKLRISSTNLSLDEIKKLSQIVNIESIGLYFATIVQEEIRLSIDATHIFKQQINKNIIEINQQEKDEWLHGRDLQRKNENRGFVIIRYKNGFDDFLGTGKLSQDKIGNFVPKERRIKN